MTASKTLTPAHQQKYAEFYDATLTANSHLSERETWLVGLAAAIALDCQPCQRFYVEAARKHGVDDGAIREILAKVMAVSAGQKRLQFQETLERYGIALEASEP